MLKGFLNMTAGAAASLVSGVSSLTLGGGAGDEKDEHAPHLPPGRILCTVHPPTTSITSHLLHVGGCDFLCRWLVEGEFRDVSTTVSCRITVADAP